MQLNNDNYFDIENEWKYISNSQIKDFSGRGGAVLGCESRAMAKLNGKWKEEPSTAMLVGSYCDSYWEGSLEKFKIDHPECFTIKGELRSEFKKAEEIIALGEKDELFKKYMSGEKQVIMTANILGADFKIKIDSYHPGVCIVDLKIVKSIRDKVWDNGAKVNFIDNYGYILQAAIYQEVVKENTGNQLPFYIAAISKESVPDMEIIQIPQDMMDITLSEIKGDVERILSLKNHDEPPVRCEKCDYCRLTKKLSAPISYYDL